MTRLRIMHVEDEKIVAMEAEMELADLGHVVCSSVSSGEAALEALEAARPDVLIMDIRLDGSLDGIETAERILAKRRIPVIFCTAYTNDETRRRAERLGPAGYISKPIDYAMLQALLMKMEPHA